MKQRKVELYNEKLGTWTCSNGGEAGVFQTKKNGRHFYTRCECCGLQQGTGKTRQQRIWNEAQWLVPVDQIAKPSNVDGELICNDKGPQPYEEIDQEFDFDATDDPEPQGQVIEHDSGFNAYRVLGGLALIGAAVGGGFCLQTRN